MASRIFVLIAFVAIIFSCENKQPAPKIAQPKTPAPDTFPKIVAQEPAVPDSNLVHIYFTVDDGPSAFSGDILEMAEAEDVAMTVFLVGSNCITDQRADFVNNYHASRLVEVANHSFCHAYNDYDNWYLDPKAVLADFEKNEDKMLVKNKIARLPGRAIWDLGKREKCIFPTGASSGKLLGERGYQVFGWDVEWHYFRKTGLPKESPEQVVADIEKHLRTGEVFTKNHVVLLLHERHFQEKEAVRRLIRLLKSAGYQFSYLGNYPKEA